MQKIYIHNQTILKPYENELVSTYVKGEPVVEFKDIPLQFKGKPMPIETVWAQCIAFFLDHAKDEVQLRGYYHPEAGWKLHAFPQEYPCGMHTKELDDHPNFAEDRKFFNDEWCLFMSIHHHCSASAFQSGTDLNDEKNYPGLHVTLGNLNKSPLDWHARVNFAGTFTPPILSQWFCSTKYPFLDQLPEKYRETIIKDMLVDPGNRAEYPQRWKDNLIRKQWGNPKLKHHNSAGYKGNRYWEYEPPAPIPHEDSWFKREQDSTELNNPKTDHRLDETDLHSFSTHELWLSIEDDERGDFEQIEFAPSCEYELYGYKTEGEMFKLLDDEEDRFAVILKTDIESLWYSEFLEFGYSDAEDSALDKSSFIVVSAEDYSKFPSFIKPDYSR